MKKLGLAILAVLILSAPGWTQDVKPARFPIPTVSSITTSATPTPVINSTGPVDFKVTALAGDAAIAAPTGSAVSGQILTIYIKDNGAPHALSWNAAYVAINVTLPLTTVASKWVYIGCKYNATDSKWHVLAVGQES